MRKRDLIIIFGAVAAALVLGISQLFFQTVETGAWGLSFSGGQTPSAPISAERLKQYDAYYIGNTAEKVIYLTFDAGYENGYTEKLLDVLKKHNAPAAFFLVGNYLEKNPDLVRRMVAEGHIVGNHTMHHPDMEKTANFEKELTDLEALFREITGKELPKFYRPPQGVYTEAQLQKAKEMGYKTVFWSLAYADWENNHQPDKAFALEKVLGRTHGGAVVLLHATSKTNAELLEELLTKWEEMGYRLAPITELG